MRNSFLLILGFLIVSCDANQVYDQYQSVTSNWEKDDKKIFSFEAPDTINTYNLFINLRSTNDYKYNNLFLISSLEFPNGKVVTDTLQYKMAAPDGTLLGEGFSSIKENKLWYKGHQQPFKFTEEGEYTLTVSHAMRSYGEVSGVEVLEGITDIGFRIETTTD